MEISFDNIFMTDHTRRLDVFLLLAEQAVEHNSQVLAICDMMMLMWCHLKYHSDNTTWIMEHTLCYNH